MIDRCILIQIKRLAVWLDWHVAFDGKAQGNRHLLRVVTLAKFLAQKEGASLDICEAAAWLHDTSLVDGNDDDPMKVRAYAEKFLLKLPLDEKSKRRIAECVETHEGGQQAVSLEAEIVHDADVLDKMGLLGVIRHTWKIVRLIKPDASANEIFIMLQNHLKERRENIYTPTAQKLGRVLNQSLDQFFEDRVAAIEMLQMIIQFAKKGIISDKIARIILQETGNQDLKLQLHITPSLLEELYIREPERVLLLQGI